MGAADPMPPGWISFTRLGRTGIIKPTPRTSRNRVMKMKMSAGFRGDIFTI